MASDRRELLLTGRNIGLTWFSPVVLSVSLPSHAQTSLCYDQLWSFVLEFTEVTCPEEPDCFTGNPADIGSGSGIFAPEKETEFCLSEAEISARAFSRDIDFDGNGPVADYLFVSYIIDTVTDSKMTGTVTSTSVDTFIKISGIWIATLIA